MSTNISAACGLLTARSGHGISEYTASSKSVN
jgi:hypothetical protein